MYCPTHRPLYDERKKDQVDGFSNQRTIHIDLATESRRKFKPVDMKNIKVFN